MTPKIEIHIACRDLLDVDIFSKSDPMVVMFIETKVGRSREWSEYGRTEVIENNLNPDFVKTFIVDYHFEKHQNLKFEVYDVDSKSDELFRHGFIGRAECSLGSIVGQHSGRRELNLEGKSGKEGGKIVLSAELLRDCTELVTFQFKGTNIRKTGVFSSRNLFLVFSKINEDNSSTVVHKTEVQKDSHSPIWKAIKIPVRLLCNGDHERTIKISCYDWSRNGQHKLIGEVNTSVKELKCLFGMAYLFELIHLRKKAKKKDYKNSGALELIQFCLEAQPTFLDFVHAGTELCFSVAIDFSKSNGNPNVPSSLHFKNPYDPNDYVKCITAVGKIIEDYDTDKMFPAFGFGARFPSSSTVMQEFTLNGTKNPSCNGMEGILYSYYDTLDKVQLSDPANFSPAIRNVSRIAAAAEKVATGKKYFILVILTDGIISDMLETKEAIVKAAKLPISIVIVGIGNANFAAMRELDGDDIRVSSRGRYADRDIVQFVQFQNFCKTVGLGGEEQVNEEELAKAILEEIPDQLCHFMKMKQVQPDVMSWVIV